MMGKPPKKGVTVDLDFLTSPSKEEEQELPDQPDEPEQPADPQMLLDSIQQSLDKLRMSMG